MQLEQVSKVWDRSEHAAFTDLCHFQGRLLLCFREGEAHVCNGGRIRILTCDPAEQDWQSVALIERSNTDLRDPKLLVTGKGQLLLTCAGIDREAEKPVHQSYIAWSEDASTWTELNEAGDPDMWIWRSRELADAIYGVAYSYRQDKVALYRLTEPSDYRVHVDPLFGKESHGFGYPNEHDLALLDDGSAICLLRRDKDTATAQLGEAKPPYLDWQWHDLGEQVGGPAMLKLKDGRILCALRLYDPVRTTLCWLDLQSKRLEEVKALPSGGDTSYPGLVELDGRIYCAYYSSHEGKTAIYIAVLSLA